MNSVETKFRTLVESGKHQTPQEDSKVVALESKVKKLTKILAKVAEAEGAGDDADKGKRRRSGKSNKKDFPEWMTVAPTDGTLGPKTMDDKEYWWCEALKRWCIHKPEECKLAKKSENDEKTKSKSKTKSDEEPAKEKKKSSLKSTPKWQTAVTALIDSDSGDESDQ
jgi:hypothetical protein